MPQEEGSILDHGRQVKTGMVVHGIDPAAGDFRPGLCLPLLGELFSY